MCEYWQIAQYFAHLMIYIYIYIVKIFQEISPISLQPPPETAPKAGKKAHRQKPVGLSYSIVLHLSQKQRIYPWIRRFAPIYVSPQ